MLAEQPRAGDAPMAVPIAYRVSPPIPVPVKKRQMTNRPGAKENTVATVATRYSAENPLVVMAVWPPAGGWKSRRRTIFRYIFVGGLRRLFPYQEC
jgi:hypothetical protein